VVASESANSGASLRKKVDYLMSSMCWFTVLQLAAAAPASATRLVDLAPGSSSTTMRLVQPRSNTATEIITDLVEVEPLRSEETSLEL